MNEVSIGKRLEHIRGRESQAAFAERVGVHKNTWGNYERDEREISAEALIGLGKLGWNPLWVLTGEGERTISPTAQPSAAVDTALIVAKGDSAAYARRDAFITRLSVREGDSQVPRSKGEILQTATKLLTWAFGLQGAVFDSVRDADLLAETYEFLAEHNGEASVDNLVDFGERLARRRAKEQGNVGDTQGADAGSSDPGSSEWGKY